MITDPFLSVGRIFFICSALLCSVPFECSALFVENVKSVFSFCVSFAPECTYHQENLNIKYSLKGLMFLLLLSRCHPINIDTVFDAESTHPTVPLPQTAIQQRRLIN